jgi:hypothetical protein
VAGERRAGLPQLGRLGVGSSVKADLPPAIARGVTQVKLAGPDTDESLPVMVWSLIRSSGGVSRKTSARAPTGCLGRDGGRRSGEDTLSSGVG